MPIEIEKKYSLSSDESLEIELALKAAGVVFEGRRFEKNVIYSNETAICGEGELSVCGSR